MGDLMKTNDYTKINHKKASQIFENKCDNKISYLKNLITRILMSIILVLSICIFMKLDDQFELLIDEYFFQKSLKFTKINNWYQDNIGNIIPVVNKQNSSLVFSSNDLQKNSYENYLNGVKINVEVNSPISLINGGIVVFIGEKEGYGNTLILQGNDGIDYWYGGINNLNVNLYDYLEKDTLIGETINNYLYLVLQKEGNYINYDEFIQ